MKAGFLDSKAHWIICAPTGSGKTMAALWAIQRALDSGRRAAYVAPLKAIVEEKQTEWEQSFSTHQLGLYTGETTRAKQHVAPRAEGLLLFTPEKLAAYVRSWKQHHSWLSELDVLVLDEFHLLGDPHRGPNLETLLDRLLRINPFLQVVTLSATLSNAGEIGDWLNARVFSSNWRLIPISHRLARFKNVNQKEELLLSEVEATLAAGGKVLVFVNSRKRTERLVNKLSELGVRADFNHAGLSRDRRLETARNLQHDRLDVVVATSTLEMGVNFPVRKVVVYDAYTFDGTAFTPISIQRYRQFAGRAGRPGMDTEGEAVLFAPTWAHDLPDYFEGDPEPVTSHLYDPATLSRELLYEVASRLSISVEHLETNFLKRALSHRSGIRVSVKTSVEQLVKGDLLKEKDGPLPYLSVTPLGKVAAQMGVAPETIMLFSALHDMGKRHSAFDLLLASCMTREVTPKLGFNFEEIDFMTEELLSVPSALLDAPPAGLASLPHKGSEREILSAIKCATLLLQHTQGETVDDLAETYDCYPADLEILKQNAERQLTCAQRVFGILRKKDDAEARVPSLSERLCEDVALMIRYGIPPDALGLVRIPRIGAKRARALMRAGIMTPSAVSKADPSLLSALLGLKESTTTQIQAGAREIRSTLSEDGPFSSLGSFSTTRAERSTPATWPSDIDPYRLRRALELRVDHNSAEAVIVSGGTEPHKVSIEVDAFGQNRYTCDCADYAKRQKPCKHILRARLERNDDEDILTVLQELQRKSDRPLRFSLGELWMRVGSLYDAFNDRSVDYEGARFLKKARTRHCAR